MKRSSPFALLALTGLLLTACGGNTPTDGVAPTIELMVAPTTVTAAGTVNLTATATDDVGVTKVTFYRGTTEIGTDTTAPYEFADNVTEAQNGDVIYRAVATDAAGNTADAAKTVTINISTTPVDTTKPTVTLVAAPTTVTAAGAVNLTATATDDVGVTKVTFYRGNTEIGTDTTAPYELADNVTKAQNGDVIYRAVATDAAGNTAEATQTVTVNISTTPADTTKPTVTLVVAPKTITAAGAVNLTATATDDVGVTKVTFYRGTTEIGTDTTAPYTLSDNVTAANNGTLNYRAVATDAAGNTAEATQTVTVNISTTPADTTKPTVTLVAAPKTVTAAGAVNLTATATDDVGVTKVTFYRGTTEIGTDTTAPYEFKDNVTAANNGTLNYRAVATDAAGNKGESTTTVTVKIDTTKPTISLTAAPAVVTAAGAVNLTATATDDVGVTKVTFYRGTTEIGTDTTAPYEFKDNVTAANNGTLNYRAVATDAAGNSAEATATVKVDVDPNEPNDSVATATSLNIGTPINGKIAGQDRDMDYFKFSGTQGDMLKLTVKSTSIDAKSTLDPYVMILLADGKTVLEKDDDGGADLESEIRFNVPKTGTYYVALTSFEIHDDVNAKDNKATNTYQIALTRR